MSMRAIPDDGGLRFADQHILDGVIHFYPCHDIAATVDFYNRDLGLDLIRDQGNCVIFRVGPKAYLGFCVHEGALPQHEGIILTFLSEEVDAVYRHLRRLNVETEGQPKDNQQFQIYHFFARDPDGYRIEIQRFYDPL